MKIISPMAIGNGAFIVHKTLEKNLINYAVAPYNPYLTLLPLLLPLIARQQADIIHTTPDYGCFFPKKGVPLVVTLHNYVLDPYMRPFSSALQNIHYQTDLKWFIKRSLQKAARITSVSRFTANVAKQHLQFDGEIQVIPNGVDNELFFPQHHRRRAKKIKVLFSGNLTPRKGAQWLPQIAEKFNTNIELLYTQGLNKTKWALAGENVHCIGTIPYQEMASLYNSVDILLMPTVREGMCLAVLEAMACGLPVVTTDCSSMPELIDSAKGGFLCPIADVQLFADRINQLADDAHLRLTMGEYNRSVVEDKFTLLRMVKAYLTLFEEVLDSNPGNRS